MITRRKFLWGLVAAPAVVSAVNLMPVRALAVFDPIVQGLRYQSYPIGSAAPIDHFVGYMEGPGRLSHFEAKVKALEGQVSMTNRAREIIDDFYWEPMT